MDNSYNILIKLFDKYELHEVERDEIYEIIKNIFLHEEFQRRCTSEFLHHGNTTLGEHILENTIITYLLLCNSKRDIINLELSLKVSMMHDLYTLPWQNTFLKKDTFFHKHGFSHPIEAVINSINWFKEEFEDDYKAQVLIDGIIHHMYPLPVLSFKESKTNELELNNYKLIKNISKKHRKMIINSSNRGKIGSISLSKSIYLEGRILSRADKISTINQLNCFSDAKALVTGKNKNLIK